MINKIAKIFDFGLEFIAIFITSLLFYLNLPIYLQNSIIEVKSGRLSSIVDNLKSKNIDLNRLDKLLINSFGYAQAGFLDFKSDSLKRAKFYHILTSAKSATVDIQLIPGETLYFFFEDISKELNLDKDKLSFEYLTQTNSVLDGMIMPESYTIPLGINEKNLISYLLNLTKESHSKIAKEYSLDINSQEWLEILVKASIIQKESASISEMPLVSSVIRNRLKLNMPLQMDGSLNYGKFSHTKVTKEMIESDNSTYNTYKFTKLPKYPVSSVSKEAIISAIKPANSNYLYFVKGSDGTHLFTNSYDQHIKNINNGKK